MFRKLLLTIVVFFFLLSAGVSPGSATAVAQGNAPGWHLLAQGEPLQIIPRDHRRSIGAPEGFVYNQAAKAAAAQEFNITYLGVWTAEQTAAFEYAVAIWASLLEVSFPISVTVEFGSSSGLASTQTYLSADRPFLPRQNFLYPDALANQYAGYDTWPGVFDFKITFSPSSYWFFGTGGNTPGDKLDFAMVALHEIGHGLGFNAGFAVDRWIFYYPTIYDLFVENGAGQQLINTALFPNPSAALAAQLTSGNVFFDGLKTRGANQNQPGKLYSPATFSGSSIEHLDEIYNGTANTVMTYSVSWGEWMHTPGPITLGIVADLGWKTTANFPIIYQLPSQLLRVNTQRTGAIDLWAYSPATQSPGTNFTYSIVNSPADGAGVSLRGNRYIDVAPAPGWLGNTQVNIRATNTQGFSADASFKVYVVEEILPLFLPAIIK